MLKKCVNKLTVLIKYINKYIFFSKNIMKTGKLFLNNNIIV